MHNVYYMDKNPAYIGTSVIEVWKNLSVFKKWRKTQTWESPNMNTKYKRLQHTTDIY